MLHTKSPEDVLYLEQTSCHILNEKMSEIERLQKEAEYLARLIKDHKSRSASSSSHTSVAAAGAAAPRAYCNPSQVPYRQTSWHGRPTTTADNHAVRRKTQSHRASDAKSSIDHKQSKPPYKPPSRTQTNREVKLSATGTKTWSTSQSKSTVSAAVAGNVGKVAASGDPPPIVHIVPSTSSCRDLKLTKATTVKLSQSNISSSIPRTGSLSGNKSSCPAESGGPKEKTASSVGATKNNPVVTTDKIEAAQNLLLQIKKSMSSGQDGHSTKHLPSSPRKAQHPSRYKFEKRETLEPKQTSASTRSSGVLQNQKSHYEDTGHHNRRVVLPTRYKQNVNTSKLKASRYRFVKGHANLSPAQYPRDLSSIAKSPAMVVKLRTKYKLVKKAKLTKQRFMSNRLSSRKHSFSRSRTYSASPRPKPRVTRYSYHGTSAQGGVRFTHQGAAACSPRYNRYKLIRYGVQSYNSSKFTSGLNYRRRMVTRNVGRFSVSRSGATHYQRRSSVSSTPSGKTVTVRGDFVVGKRGKSLRRVSREKPYFPNVSKLKSTTVKTYTSTRMSAFKALQRSKYTVTAPKKKTGKAEYCKFYSRFGRCSRGTKCKFIHDPKRVALCTRFLRGTCTLTNCAFSHDVSAEKMPVCSYFLKGICNRDKCPYSHVNVSKDADVCLDFVSGFCPLGSKCKKRHTLVCPEYQKTGKCLEGKKCAMKHNHSKARKRAKSDSKPRKDEPRVKQVKMDATKSYTPLGDLEVPFKERELPSFISLSTSGTTETDESTNVSKEDTPKLAKSPLIIRPRFSFEKK